MFKTPLAIALVLGLTGLTAPAFADDTVDLEDLARLPVESLDTLKEVHHQVALAQIALVGTEREKELARKEVETARKEVAVEEADRKAAEAELNAARKNRDDVRTRAAETDLDAARAALEKAKILVKWREQEVKVREARIDAAKAVLEQREAEREYARAELVVTARIENSARYSISRFRSRMEGKTRDVVKKEDRVRKEEEKATQLQADYAARSGS
jgi:hypothetical protein